MENNGRSWWWDGISGLEVGSKGFPLESTNLTKVAVVAMGFVDGITIKTIFHCFINYDESIRSYQSSWCQIDGEYKLWNGINRPWSLH